MTKWVNEEGSMTVEAAVLLPVFIVFFLVLLVMVKLSVVDAKLQSVVTESVKQISAHGYPICVLLDEIYQSQAGEWLTKIHQSRQQLKDMEVLGETENMDFIHDYRVFIPDFIIELIRWEKQIREGTEKQLMHAAIRPVLSPFVDKHYLNMDNMEIVSVTLPSCNETSDSYFALEIRYEIQMHLPFIQRSFTLHKKAIERAWIGSNFSRRRN